MMNNEMNMKEMNEVRGGAKAAAVKEMLVCSACGNTMDPVKANVTIFPGEMTECPRCHQVAMMIKKVKA